MKIPCYVSGKGMHATDRTRTFKIEVIQTLESRAIGFDTRYRYYQSQFPEMDGPELAKMICEPIEYYDRDWAGYRATQIGDWDEDAVLAKFVKERDDRFRREAQAAIYCYDEAGLGSGINTMRLLEAGKPILGFYHFDAQHHGMNVTNVLQLGLEFPALVTLARYRSLEDIQRVLLAWLRTFQSSYGHTNPPSG